MKKLIEIWNGWKKVRKCVIHSMKLDWSMEQRHILIIYASMVWRCVCLRHMCQTWAYLRRCDTFIIIYVLVASGRSLHASYGFKHIHKQIDPLLRIVRLVCIGSMHTHTNFPYDLPIRRSHGGRLKLSMHIFTVITLEIHSTSTWKRSNYSEALLDATDNATNEIFRWK